MSRSKAIYGAVAALLVVGCAEERPPRSFVQPNVIKKGDLQGTWYYLQTVTDSPVTNGASFIGLSSSLLKIKFDLQQDYLYARRAFEQIEGSEDAKVKDPKGYSGEVLAAWKISSQFDIIRDYNSTTGEQTNKIIESTERPWQDREFIRVDWSQNLVTDYTGLGLNFWFDDVKIESVSYWQSNPTHPDALHFERNQNETHPDGFIKGEATYIDVTDQLIVSPEELTACYEEGGRRNCFTYPKCFFYYQQEDCAAQKIKVRHAFSKIGPTHDYEPRMWDGNQMQLFGVWDVGLRRLAYNRQYGVINSAATRRAARFNIWQKSYTTSDQGKTRMLPKDRLLREIPYYAEGTLTVAYNNDDLFPDGVDSTYPEDLYPEFHDIIGEWNSAMKVAAFDAMFDGKGGMYQGRQITKAEELPDIFLACHNPVRTSEWSYQGKAMPADPAGCVSDLAPDMGLDGKPILDKKGNQIYHARQGDPRRSTVFWVNQQQNGGPLGYGPPMYDEETGETISGQAYIFGGAVDSYTARTRDLMLLQNGELAQQDYIDGVNVQEWVNQHKFGVPNKPQTFERNEVMAMSTAMDFEHAKGFSPDYGYPALDISGSKALKRSIDARQGAIYTGYYDRVKDAKGGKLTRLIGSPLEKAMVTPELMAASGVSPMKKWDELSQFDKARVSPLRWRTMEAQAAKERMFAEMTGMDFAQFDEPGMSQRLVRLIAKYGATLAPHSEEIRQVLRKDIYKAVTLHEVGHNMGCRHNFRASYDAMNYFPDFIDPTDGPGAKVRPGYWNLRTEALNHPDQGMQPGDGKLHPRYVNKPGGAITRYEADNGIRETQYSSVMDYGSEFNSDLLGLGLYDKAHIKFSYAEYVEVFVDNKTDPTTLKKFGSMHTFQSALGFPSALDTGSDLAAISYQSYPTLFQSGWEGIYKRVDVPYADISEKPIDQSSSIISDSQGHPLVPYYFCSDEFAGNLTCQRFDAGADSYEQVTDTISRYQNFYIVNNFKRDRQSFHTSLSYKSRIASRYFDPLRSQLTWYVLLRDNFQEFLTTNAQLGFGDPNRVVLNENKFFVDEEGWGAFTVAVNLGFEMIGKTITTPTAGWFYQASQADGLKLWKQVNDRTDPINDPKIRTVNVLDGKYVDTTWDFDVCGYYWAEECQKRVGYMVDKQIALDVLSESQAYFTGRDTNADVRQYAIGYVIPYKKQIEEKFGAIFASDMNSIAPYFKRVQGEFTPIQPSWSMPDPTIVKMTNGVTDVIDPAMGFTVQLYAGVYGLAAFPTTFDHDFIDTTKIFVLGNGEATTSDTNILADGTTDPKQLVSAGGNKEWFYVKDPSGKTFAAHATAPVLGKVLDAAGLPGDVYEVKTVPLRNDQGVRMLEHLKSLADALAAANALPVNDPKKVGAVTNATNEYEKYRENVEVMRSLHNAFGYGQYRTDAPFYY